MWGRYTVVYEGDPNGIKILSGEPAPGRAITVIVGDQWEEVATLRAERDKLRSELAGIVEGWREQNERLAADLREAREERDSMVAWAKSATMACDKAYIALTAEEDNLVALAKMYGEACSELQVLRTLAQDVADEADDAEYDGFLLTPDPHHAAGSASEESDDASGS